ncbi:phage repressor protein [Enterobacter hormaechei]|uniref:phage repressor protein n=1 Tax=Enterobacter hormaechei TaxID=158836 RepID=UPI003D701F78
MKKTALEKEYRNFIAVAERWRSILAEHEVFHDTNGNGDAFRFIAVTSDSAVLDEAKECLRKWQEFADLCQAEEGAATLAIPEPTFLPVPFIVEDTAQATQIYHRRATPSTTLTREQILKKYDSIIKKGRASPVLAPVIRPMLAERKIFENEPAGSKFRVRKTSFTEAVIGTAKSKGGALTRYRVGSHGALIFAQIPGLHVPVVDQSERRSATMYDDVLPVPCAPLGEYKLYRVSDLDMAQRTSMTRSYIQKCIEARTAKFSKLEAERLRDAPPALRPVMVTKFKNARVMLDKVNTMDAELIDAIAAAGDDIGKIKLRSARALYGKEIEARHGISFEKAQGEAKVYTPRAAKQKK